MIYSGDNKIWLWVSNNWPDVQFFLMAITGVGIALFFFLR